METSKAPAASAGKTNPASRSLRQIMSQHPFLSFVVMAFAFSWLLTIPFILWEWGFLPGTLQQWSLVFAIKAYAGPFLAAYIITRVTEGKAGWLRMRRSIVQWRAGWQWYAFILLAFPAFFLLGIAITPGAFASFTGFSLPDLIALPIALVLITLAGGPLAEEPGWRGYALPHLLAHFGASRYPALKASLALGVIWTCWHLPDFLTRAQHGGPEAGLRPYYANLPVFFLMIMALTIIFTWVFNRTGGSVFMAILLHAVLNTLGNNIVPLFPIPAVTGSELPVLIGWGTLALLVLILTRGRLGFSLDQAPPRRAGPGK